MGSIDNTRDAEKKKKKKKKDTEDSVYYSTSNCARGERREPHASRTRYARRRPGSRCARGRSGTERSSLVAGSHRAWRTAGQTCRVLPEAFLRRARERGNRSCSTVLYGV